jgi:hypothetical protein
MLGSWRLTLRHPGWWAISLAAFLVRGGVVAVALPILALPTISAVSTAVAPFIGEVALGSPTASALVVLVATLVLVSGLIVGTGLLGAWLDIALLEETLDVPLDGRAGVASGRLRSGLNARLTPHVLSAVALAVAAVQLVDATYQELTSPSGAAPLIVRVLERTPVALVAVLVAWAIAEAIGGLALRSYVTADAADASVPRALRLGLRNLLRPTGLATLVLTNVVILGIAATVGLLTSAAWADVRGLPLDAAWAPQQAAALVLFVVAWAVGLWALGVGLAWRATAWTAQWLHGHPDRHLAPDRHAGDAEGVGTVTLGAE